MTAPNQDLLRHALQGDREAFHGLVQRLTPVVQLRVARAMARYGVHRKGGARQMLEDSVQQVLLGVFEEDAKVLRAWNPDRSLSLEDFVGMIAEREVATLLRSRTRNPWTEDPTLQEDMEAHAGHGGSVEDQVCSRELLQRVLVALQERLSPLGWAMFQAAVVEQRELTDLCEAFQMKPDAVYAWRSRLEKLIRTVVAELDEKPVRNHTARSYS